MDNLADNNDSDVEIQVYSKSNSEANVMAIMEITFEVAMERGLPSVQCRCIMPDEILSEC